MADQKTAGPGPLRERGTGYGSEQRNPPALKEVGVCGETLLESEYGAGETLIRLHGALDLSAAEKIDQQQLCAAMENAPEVCLDLTGLTDACPEALRLFLERQRRGLRAAQRLSIRIDPAQVSELLPPHQSQ